jgi:hypothetical protein
MIKTPNTGFATINDRDNTIYINNKDVLALLKEDLIELLSNPDQEMFASEYIKDRILLIEHNVKRSEETFKKRKEEKNNK